MTLRVLGAAAVAVAALAAVPAALANQGYDDDPLYIGATNTSICTHPNPSSFCLANPSNNTTELDTLMSFPYSGFLVTNGIGQDTPADGFAITGDSQEGTGLYGLAHADKPAISAENTSSGAALFAQGHFGDAVVAKTPAANRSGVYGENTGGNGWGVVGRTNADQKVGVWGDNTGGGNGVFGSSHGSAASGVYGENFFGGWGVAGRANGGRPGVLGENVGSGDGIEGIASAANQSGVYAHHDSASIGTGLWGQSAHGTGVFGKSLDGNGIHGEGTRNGVEGLSANSLASGVYGENSDGYGVAGRATGPNGIGVLATAIGGFALKADGRSLFTGPATLNQSITVGGQTTLKNGVAVTGKASFSRSGVITLSSAAALTTKTGIALTSSSYVLATLQTDTAGLTIRSAVPNPGASTITIHFNQAAPAGTKVAWFVVN
jgi:hypothetical protein